jgi:hypothetical protein
VLQSGRRRVENIDNSRGEKGKQVPETVRSVSEGANCPKAKRGGLASVDGSKRKGGETLCVPRSW